MPGRRVYVRAMRLHDSVAWVFVLLIAACSHARTTLRLQPVPIQEPVAASEAQPIAQPVCVGDVERLPSAAPDAPNEATRTEPPTETAQTTNPATARGYLSERQILDSIRGQVSTLVPCGLPGPRSPTSVRIELRARWLIDLDGRVGAACVDPNGEAVTAELACVANAIHTWTFPVPDGGRVAVSFPFLMRRREIEPIEKTRTLGPSLKHRRH